MCCGAELGGPGRPTGCGEALPDSSDGGLQGGDHVFDEEVIPVAPVFRHGLPGPGIWEGDTHTSTAATARAEAWGPRSVTAVQAQLPETSFYFQKPPSTPQW